MDIVSLLHKHNVLHELEADTKEEVLNKLIATLSDEVDEKALEEISNAVFEREAIMSTGVGKGLAIPHGKASGISETYAAFATLKKPVDYEAVDGEPVIMIFLLVGPKSSNSLHIKMLSRISRLMNNSSFREKLKECSSADEIIGVFEEEEKVHFGS